MSEILKKPIINEKFSQLNEKGIYGFIVAREANKIEIKKAVNEAYGVNVEKVNTHVVLGKFKQRNTKGGVVGGRKPTIKKAIVYLAEGEIIDFYSEAN
jgi:large subunit ribosomal protein L23